MAHEGPSLDLSGKPLEGHCGESDLEQEPGGFPRQSLRAVTREEGFAMEKSCW